MLSNAQLGSQIKIQKEFVWQETAISCLYRQLRIIQIHIEAKAEIPLLWILVMKNIYQERTKVAPQQLSWLNKTIKIKKKKRQMSSIATNWDVSERGDTLDSYVSSRLKARLKGFLSLNNTIHFAHVPPAQPRREFVRASLKWERWSELGWQ